GAVGGGGGAAGPGPRGPPAPPPAVPSPRRRRCRYWSWTARRRARRRPRARRPHRRQRTGGAAAAQLRSFWGSFGAGKCQTAPPSSTRPVHAQTQGRVTGYRPHLWVPRGWQCVQMPVSSITGDFGVKPTARAAEVSVVATSLEDASPP